MTDLLKPFENLLNEQADLNQFQEFIDLATSLVDIEQLSDCLSKALVAGRIDVSLIFLDLGIPCPKTIKIEKKYSGEQIQEHSVRKIIMDCWPLFTQLSKNMMWDKSFEPANDMLDLLLVMNHKLPNGQSVLPVWAENREEDIFIEFIYKNNHPWEKEEMVSFWSDALTKPYGSFSVMVDEQKEKLFGYFLENYHEILKEGHLGFGKPENIQKFLDSLESTSMSFQDKFWDEMSGFIQKVALEPGKDIPHLSFVDFATDYLIFKREREEGGISYFEKKTGLDPWSWAIRIKSPDLLMRVIQAYPNKEYQTPEWLNPDKENLVQAIRSALVSIDRQERFWDKEVPKFYDCLKFLMNNPLQWNSSPEAARSVFNSFSSHDFRKNSPFQTQYWDNVINQQLFNDVWKELSLQQEIMPSKTSKNSPNLKNQRF